MLNRNGLSLIRVYLPVIAALISCRASLQAAEDTDSLLQRWKTQAQAIRSYDVEISARIEVYSETHEKMMLLGHYRVRQRFREGNWRIDYLEKEEHYLNRPVKKWKAASSKDHLSFARAGDETRFYNSDREFGQIFPLGTLSPVALPIRQLFECYRSGRHGEFLADMLRDRESSVQEMSPEAYLLSCGTTQARHNQANSRFRVLLDKHSGYLPVRIVSGQDLSDQGNWRSEIENRFQTTNAGLRIPVQTTQRKYSRERRGSMQEPVVIETLTVNLEKSRFNIEIPAEVFQMSFPRGTLVYDTGRRLNFLQKNEDQRDYEGASREILKRREREKATRKQ